MSINYKLEVNKATLSFANSILAMDLNTLGDNAVWYAWDPLVANNWTTRILRMIDDLKQTKTPYKKIADMFPNMSELRVKMWFDLWTSYYSKASKKERIKIAKFYIRLLKARCKTDPYAFSKNIIHTNHEVNSLLNKLKPANSLIAKKIGRMVSAFYHLGHAAYSDMYPSVVYENYGPYQINKFGPNHILAIKQFDNLKCPELWSETKNFPWTKIELICVYKNINMTVDSSSHAIFTGDLINNLKYYSLRLIGKNASIDKISGKTEKMAIKLFNKLQGFKLEIKKQKYYHQKAYVYKGIYNFLNQDWRPSKEILDEAKNKPLYNLYWPKTKKQKINLIIKHLNPYV